MSTCGVCLTEFDPTQNESQWRGHNYCMGVQGLADSLHRVRALEMDNQELEETLRDQDLNIEGLKKELQELQR